MTSDFAGERVLVIDDESSSQVEIAEMVRTTGLLVDTTASAAEARDWLMAEDFALVVCDLGMPGEGGIGLARWIRDEHQDVAVLIATRTNDPVVADALLTVGVYGYLTKPFKRNEVAISVASALRRRRLEIDQRDFRDDLEPRFQELVAQLPAIVYMWEAGPDGKCYSVSPAIEPVLGYAPEEWLAYPGLWVRRIHPDDRDRV